VLSLPKISAHQEMRPPVFSACFSRLHHFWRVGLLPDRKISQKIRHQPLAKKVVWAHGLTAQNNSIHATGFSLLNDTAKTNYATDFSPKLVTKNRAPTLVSENLNENGGIGT